MAKNKEPEIQKLDENDHKGTRRLAKLIKGGCTAAGVVALAVKNKDKIADVAKIAAKVIIKK